MCYVFYVFYIFSEIDMAEFNSWQRSYFGGKRNEKYVKANATRVERILKFTGGIRSQTREVFYKKVEGMLLNDTEKDQ